MRVTIASHIYLTIDGEDIGLIYPADRLGRTITCIQPWTDDKVYLEMPLWIEGMPNEDIADAYHIVIRDREIAQAAIAS